MCKDVGERGGGLRRERKEGMDEWMERYEDAREVERGREREGWERDAIDGKV